MRRATSVTLQHHEILHLPRNMTLMINPCLTYKTSVTLSGPNRCHPPTSPNIAPATKNNTPKYQRNLLQTAETSLTMWDRSDHDPRMKLSVRNPPCNRGYFLHEHFLLKKTHLELRLSLQISLNSAPATKSDT